MAEEKQPASIRVDLTGQVALVTGASRGLGKAIALELGRCGAKVVCVARDAAKLEETAAAIRELGAEAATFSCDVVNGEDVKKTVDAVIEKFGRIDILVNNAGITRDTLIPRMSDDDWDSVIDTNLKSVFLFTRAVTQPMMSQRYGRVINMSSISGGRIGNPGQSNYAASKAGIIGFTRTVAKELAKRNITVNAICPGFIESDMTKALGPALDAAIKMIPAKRLGRAEEVAQVALFFASPSSAYVTGQEITIDGGMTA